VLKVWRLPSNRDIAQRKTVLALLGSSCAVSPRGDVAACASIGYGSVGVRVNERDESIDWGSGINDIVLGQQVFGEMFAAVEGHLEAMAWDSAGQRLALILEGTPSGRELVVLTRQPTINPLKRDHGKPAAEWPTKRYRVDMPRDESAEPDHVEGLEFDDSGDAVILSGAADRYRVALTRASTPQRLGKDGRHTTEVTVTEPGARAAVSASVLDWYCGRR
jgi:hypothetical protein